MNSFNVDVVEHERIEIPFIEKDAYELRLDRGYLPLQRLLFWALRKIGAMKHSVKVEYVRHRIDAPLFIDRLYKSKRSVCELLARDPGTLLIGAEDYYEFMGGPVARQMINFSTGIHYRDRDGDRFIGMKVVVVPWMVGILPIPDSLLTKGNT